MRLPVQALPVQRASVSFALDESRDGMLSALYSSRNGVVASAESGVDASGFWDVLKDIGKVAIPIAQQLL